MTADYKDKHIWIVGASSGIGRALAVNLADHGAKLILSARSKESLDQLNSEIAGDHMVLPLDISDADELSKAVSQIEKKYDRLDSVISMAAIYKPGLVRDLDPEETEKLVQINLLGVFYLVHAVLPLFRQQGYGQIALTGSVAGYCGLPKGQPYSATKAAVINFAESLRAEEARNGIDVKIINPGFVKTPMTNDNDFDMPMIITPEDAARAILSGLQKKKFEIHFPRKFTFLVKALAALPYYLYFKLASKITK